MTRRSRETKAPWLTFTCPSCKVCLRIKVAYAALRGRCPECGYRIDPLRPAPAAPTPAGDEPPGLVPLEDEWPEPARVVDREERSSYGLAAEAPPPRPPAPAPAPAAETFAFAPGEEPLVAPESAEAGERPYPVLRPEGAVLPKEAALPAPERVAELLPSPPPPPPPYPLWSGLYFFPWREDNLGVWLYQSLNFSLLAVLATELVLVYRIGGVVMIGVPLLIPVVGFVFFWTGIYASNCFLANVEDTAAGNDRVAWPKGGGLLDGLGRFGYLLLIAGISFIPVIFLVTAAHEAAPAVGHVGGGGVADGHAHPPATEAELDLWWVLPLTPWVLLFPTMLLSSLTYGSWWMILDGRIVGGLFRRPGALFLIGVPGLVLVVVSVGLAQAVLLRPNFLLAGVAGFIWSAALLIYGRLLGRAGWILSEARSVRGKRKRKKPYKGKAEVLDGAGWGELPPDERDISDG